MLDGALEPLGGQGITGSTVSGGTRRRARGQPAAIFSGGDGGATRMILSETLGEERPDGDGQRVEALGPDKGFGLSDQKGPELRIL